MLQMSLDNDTLLNNLGDTVCIWICDAPLTHLIHILIVLIAGSSSRAAAENPISHQTLMLYDKLVLLQCLLFIEGIAASCFPTHGGTLEGR